MISRFTTPQGDSRCLNVSSLAELIKGSASFRVFPSFNFSAAQRDVHVFRVHFLRASLVTDFANGSRCVIFAEFDRDDAILASWSAKQFPVTFLWEGTQRIFTF